MPHRVRDAQNKNGGRAPAVSDFWWIASDHCSRRSTLCCDWLASASADTAIDCRVDSAWLLAASWLVSANVRLDEPVCSTLIRFFEKSCRICTIERFEPNAEPWVRSKVEAPLR